MLILGDSGVVQGFLIIHGFFLWVLSILLNLGLIPFLFGTQYDVGNRIACTNQWVEGQTYDDARPGAPNGVCFGP